MWNHSRTLADRLNIYRHLHLTSFVFDVLCKYVIFLLLPSNCGESHGRLMKIGCRSVIDCTNSQLEPCYSQNWFHVNQQWHCCFFISLNVPGLQSFLSMTCIEWKRARRDSYRSKSMCATVQIIPRFIKQRIEEEECGGSRKTKHVPDELVKYISWKMTYLQSGGHVPVQDLRSFYELSCHHSTLSVPYYLEDRWRLYYVSLLTPFWNLPLKPCWAHS